MNWNLFDKAFEKFDKAMDEMSDDLDKAVGSGNVSIQNSNGTTIINRDGNLEISGKIKSLKVNGKTIDLGK